MYPEVLELLEELQNTNILVLTILAKAVEKPT